MNSITPKTEQLNKSSKPIDKLNILDGFNFMLSDQKKAILAVEESMDNIVEVVDAIYNHLTLNNLGRLIYVGAGTSARIGVQDGVELYPTFNWPLKRVSFIIAGGRTALTKSVENAEDDKDSAIKSVNKISINSKDVVIGLAASGNTPFTLEVLRVSKLKKALTLAIINNPKGKMLNHCNNFIILDTKEEVIAGSTRLKAGTAQKVCLNLISSLVMVKMGFIKNGYMSNLVPTNSKLRKRKSLIEKLLEN